jgi:hypothetical protein
MAKRQKNRGGKLPFVCYGVFTALWLLLAVWRFAADRMQPPLPLAPAAAELVNIEALPGGGCRSVSVDPQMIWRGLDEEVRQVSLRAAFEMHPGEIELFYIRRDGQAFSAKNRVIAAPQPDGSWLFRLPPGRVASLRVDLGTVNRNTVTIAAVALNPRLPAAAYFVPDLRDILALLILPALACCIIYTIIEWAKAIRGGLRRA